MPCVSGMTFRNLGPLFLLCRHSFKGSHIHTAGLRQLGVLLCSQQRNFFLVMLQCQCLPSSFSSWKAGCVLLLCCAFSFLLVWSPSSTLNTLPEVIMILLVFYKVNLQGILPNMQKLYHSFWFNFHLQNLKLLSYKSFGRNLSNTYFFYIWKYRVIFLKKAEGRIYERARGNHKDKLK